MSVPSEKRLGVARAYAQYFETLSPETTQDAQGLIADDIHFIDPFNDVRGRENFQRIVDKMFEDVKEPRFDILDLAWSDDPDLCLMRWDFSCTVAYIGDWKVRGVSEIRFNGADKICAHFDYWDASRHFYDRLPLVGWMIRKIRQKASI
ncbi:nuclear transport factor 2 family protein [uncultured Cohaesibacter sp.]|uniref:nuclear transport factor 2 family protein n=1 Tax=uncultured Cohaesibacter sp. TaxID=1002546 RepID=UPI0029C623D1|nr:nuclear transport factor 2 family protein [uncultured Cohaesibacter sp.]